MDGGQPGAYDSDSDGGEEGNFSHLKRKGINQMKDQTINLGGDNKITTNALKTIVELQRNENEALHEHIYQLGRTVLWIGKLMDGFDPNNKDDIEAIAAIVSISNVAAMLQSFEVK